MVEAVDCFVIVDGKRTGLVNASSTIYRTMSLPVPLPNDSAQQIDITWILGQPAGWEGYDGQFFRLPPSTSVELHLRVLSGQTYTRQYTRGDWTVMPYELARQYQVALDTPDGP